MKNYAHIQPKPAKITGTNETPISGTNQPTPKTKPPYIKKDKEPPENTTMETSQPTKHEGNHVE